MVILASDHAGYVLKEKVKDYLTKCGINYIDLGTNSEESVDYPIFANKMAETLKDDAKDFGILICGSGIGMSIAINRHKHIRGALCCDVNTATLARQHNNANVLILAGRNKKTNLRYKKMIDAFLNTNFEGGRHQRRVDMLSN